MNGEEKFNCTKDLKIPIDDLSKPCKFLTKELEFQKELADKEGTAKKTTWTVDEIVKKLDAPVEVQIKEFEIKNFILAYKLFKYRMIKFRPYLHSPLYSKVTF